MPTRYKLSSEDLYDFSLHETDSKHNFLKAELGCTEQLWDGNLWAEKIYFRSLFA